MLEKVRWVVLVPALVAVVVVVVALLARRRGAQRAQMQRDKARELRERAVADRIEVQRREAGRARQDSNLRPAD